MKLIAAALVVALALVACRDVSPTPPNGCAPLDCELGGGGAGGGADAGGGGGGA